MGQEKGKRLARLVDLMLVLLLEPRKYNRRALAERYDVSERQITKDFELLREQLNLQIERDPQAGGYYIAGIPRLRSLELTLPEALALVLAAEAGRLVPGVSQQELDAALARLRAIFPEQLQGFLEMTSQLRRSTPSDERRRRRLQQLLQAMMNRYTVEMMYRVASRGGERVMRRVDPYCVLPFNRAWYFIGWCHERRAIRTFKVDRIEELWDTRVPFQIRSDFSLQSFLAASWGIFEAPGVAAEEVELEFSRLAAPWVAEEDWHPTQEITTLEDGRVRFRVRVPITPDFVRWVLNFGVEVVVLRPESLREQILAHARGILAKYATRETDLAGTAEAAH